MRCTVSFTPEKKHFWKMKRSKMMKLRNMDNVYSINPKLPLESLWVIVETHTKFQSKQGKYVGHEYTHGLAGQECLDQFCDDYNIKRFSFDELTEQQLVNVLLPKVATGEFGRFYIRRNTYFDF